jgi:signal transduction histidine kinase
MNPARIAERLRVRTGSLSRQLALTVAIAVAPVLIALVVFGLLMVISGHALLLVGAIVLGAGACAVAVSRPLAAEIVHDVSARFGAEEQARRDLVAAVSHDLRTPITSLRLLAEAVDDDIVDEQTRHGYLKRMRTHIDALSGLIDDLFELSRLEAGDISWSLEQVRLDELVGETVEAMRVQGELKGVSVRAEVPSSLHPARANPEKLQRVLFNLIQNAIRHTPADGSVVVRARTAADEIEIEVADSGDGIAPDERERVFTAFYRGGADAARTSDGAGLGLAISRAIVEAHGGRIWLVDAAHGETSRGTRVHFSLPAAA